MGTHAFSKWTLLLTCFLVVMGLVLILIIVQASGLLPGDDGAEAPEQARSGGSWLLDLASLPWVLFVLATTAVLGGALAYAQLRSAKTTPREVALSEAATRELHEKEKDPTFKD